MAADFFQQIGKWWKGLEMVDKILYGLGGVVSIGSIAAIGAAVISRGDHVSPSFEKFQGGVALSSFIWEIIDVGYLKERGKKNKMVEQFREGIDQLFDHLKVAATSDDLRKVAGQLKNLAESI